MAAIFEDFLMEDLHGPMTTTEEITITRGKIMIVKEEMLTTGGTSPEIVRL